MEGLGEKRERRVYISFLNSDTKECFLKS